MILRSTSLALPLALLVGCGTQGSVNSNVTPVSPAKNSVPTGKVLDLADFSLELPNTWEVVNFTEKEFMARLENAWSKDPKLQAMLPQVKAMSQNGSIKAFAFDPSSESSGFATNVNIIVLDQFAITIEKLVEANKTQLKSLATGSVETSMLKGANCDVGLLDWQMKSANGQLHFLTCVAVKGSRNFTVTFTMKEGGQETVRPIMESAIKTLKLK